MDILDYTNKAYSINLEVKKELKFLGYPEYKNRLTNLFMMMLLMMMLLLLLFLVFLCNY